MKKFLSDFCKSFSTEAGGLSARKLSAFVAVMLSCWITHLHSRESNVVELTIVWLSFALLCLGLVTFGQLIELKTGTVTRSETKVTETKTEETKTEP